MMHYILAVHIVRIKNVVSQSRSAAQSQVSRLNSRQQQHEASQHIDLGRPTWESLQGYAVTVSKAFGG